MNKAFETQIDELGSDSLPKKTQQFSDNYAKTLGALYELPAYGLAQAQHMTLSCRGPNWALQIARPLLSGTPCKLAIKFGAA